MIRPFALSMLLLGAALVAAPVMGAAYPPIEQGMALPSLTVQDEHGGETTLARLIAGAPGPVFLVPGYVTCHGACPLLARSLKTVLDDRVRRRGPFPYRVVFLSFADDDADALRDFRAREKLPDSWILVAAGDLGASKKFLDRYGYFFEKRGAEYVHPNLIFGLGRDGRWMASLIVKDGLDAKAIDRALALTGDPAVATWRDRLATGLTDPRMLLAVGVLGLLAALAAMAFAFWRPWRRAVPNAG